MIVALEDESIFMHDAHDTKNVETRRKTPTNDCYKLTSEDMCIWYTYLPLTVNNYLESMMSLPIHVTKIPKGTA